MPFAPGDDDDRSPRRVPGRPPRLSALEVFEAAARLGSFSAAAEMNLTPGAVSRQIALLESDLGTALFVRAARGVGLTPAGQRLHAAAAEALARVAAAARELRRGSEGGVVRISVPPAFAARWLRPRLPRFRAEHRQIRVVIVGENRRADRRRGGFDMAVRDTPGATAAGLESVTWLREALVPVAAPALLRDRRRTPEGIAGLPFLHAGSDADWRAWLSAAGWPDLPPPTGMVFAEDEQAIRAAVSGHGVLIGRTSLIEEELRDGRLLEAVPLRVPSRHPFRLVRPIGLCGAAVSALWEWLLCQAQDASPGSGRRPAPRTHVAALAAGFPEGPDHGPQDADAR